MVLDIFQFKLHYMLSFLLLGFGVYMVIGDRNLVKKVIGMNIFQSGIFLFFIVSAYVEGGNPPVLELSPPYVSPLPHVLILTAIVVGVSLTAVALALIVRIYSEYGTLRDDLIQEVRTDD